MFCLLKAENGHTVITTSEFQTDVFKSRGFEVVEKSEDLDTLVKKSKKQEAID